MTNAVLFSIIAGAGAGGFVSGIAGFAFGLVALAFWVWRIEPQFLAPMVVFGSLVTQSFSIATVADSFQWKRVMPFLAGGVIGVPIGVALLGMVNLRMFRVFVGIVLIIYCSFALLLANVKPVAAGGRLADAFSGVVGGIMGGLAGLTGPAPTLWCTVRGWDKDTQRCIFQSFNLTMQAVAMVIYWSQGILTLAVGKIFLLMVPVVIVPTILGARLYRRINATAFRRIVLSLLLLSGLVLLISTLNKR